MPTHDNSLSLSPDDVLLLDQACKTACEHPNMFAEAGKELNRKYSEKAYRSRLDKAWAIRHKHTHPTTKQRLEADRNDNFSPRARCESAFVDLLRDSQHEDFLFDMTSEQATRIILLTFIAHDQKAHKIAPVCEFQEIPWEYNTIVKKYYYQGRHIIRDKIRSAAWLGMVRVAISRLSKLNDRQASLSTNENEDDGSIEPTMKQRVVSDNTVPHPTTATPTARSTLNAVKKWLTNLVYRGVVYDSDSALAAQFKGSHLVKSCSVHTISAAINDSPMLVAWKCGVRAGEDDRSQYDDDAPPLDRDEAYRKIVAATPLDQRSSMETPEMKQTIIEMKDRELMDLVAHVEKAAIPQAHAQGSARRRKPKSL